MWRRFEAVPAIAWVLRLLFERFTARGRYLLVAVGIFAVLGVNLRTTQVYLLFCGAAGVLLSAAVFGLGRAPRAGLACHLPERLTVGLPLTVRASVTSEDGSALPDLRLAFSSPDPRVRFEPGEFFLSCAPEKPGEARAELCALRRGKYELRGPSLRATDPLRLVTTRATEIPRQALLVYPRYYTMDEFVVPLGRRYQPGGIPLSSNTGDSIEFVGTRDYREGDPIRHIHWRSWARRGKPVVREFQEEYFCRIAIILDTFVAPGTAAAASFEAAISVVASITDYFSRSEYIVDILAAGPDIYEVSAGRSLAYLENVLDVLACLEPCSDPPFAAVAPHLFDKLQQITTVVAVLQDWDAQRHDFLRRVNGLGAAIRAIVVHDGATREPWEAVTGELGDFSQLTPADVERLLAS